MSESTGVVRRRQYCARCGQVMFEYFRSPDGHFGVAGELPAGAAGNEVRCPTCGAHYRLLEQVSATGQTVMKI